MITWTKRLDRVNQKARETACFGYSAHTQKLYTRLLNAVKAKDAKTTKQLIVKLGF